MEKTLLKFGFKKDGLYSWFNKPFHISIYFDGLTIMKIENGIEKIIYDGIVPKNENEEIYLIEQITKLKIINKGVEELLNLTKSNRIFSNTSLNISNLLIDYLKYNDINEKDICEKLKINKEKLKQYLSGTYNFTILELSQLSVLIDKIITIK